MKDHYDTLPKKLWGVRRVGMHFFGSVSQKYVILRNFSKFIKFHRLVYQVREVPVTKPFVCVLGWMKVMRYTTPF